MTDFEPPPTGAGAPETPGPSHDVRWPRADGAATRTLDPYEILGVSPDASQAEIENAYQRFARYPELWIGSGPEREQRLVNLQAAHELLADPARRAAYDERIAHDARVSRRQTKSRQTWNPIDRMTRNLPRPWRIAIDWAVTIIGAILIVLALKQWVVNPYRIPSSSMEPTLHCATPGPGCRAHFSDRVLACRICLDFSDPSRGNIIVFKTPPKAEQKCGEGGTFVKRLIGLPGETVTERTGKVYIDGKPLKEPYIKYPDSQSGTWKVPKGQYFFMGDNRAQSCDSRQWGSVPRGNLIGTVFFVYWPPNRIGFR
jgi:signal peptidase I